MYQTIAFHHRRGSDPNKPPLSNWDGVDNCVENDLKLRFHELKNIAIYWIVRYWIGLTLFLFVFFLLNSLSFFNINNSRHQWMNSPKISEYSYFVGKVLGRGFS